MTSPHNPNRVPGANTARNPGLSDYNVHFSARINSGLGRRPRRRLWLWLLAMLPVCACCGLLTLSGSDGQVGGRANPLLPFQATPISAVRTVLAPIINPLLPVMPATVTPTPAGLPTLPFVTPTFTPNAPVEAPTPVSGGQWPMVAGDAAYTGIVYEGLGPLNPAPRWFRNPRGSGTPLVVGSGLVVFGTEAGVVRALDWATGLTAWEAPLGADISGPPSILPAFEAPLVLVPTSAGLYALNLHDGSFLWLLPAEALQGSIGGVTVGDDGALYAATDSGWLYAIEPYSGQLHLALDFSPQDSYYTPPALSGNLILMLDVNQNVRAIARDTLETVWFTESPGLPLTMTVVESQGLAVVGLQGGLVQAIWLEGGATAWVAQLSDEVAGLANDGARVFVTVSDGNVYAVESATGHTQWAVNLGSSISAAPLTDGVHVLVGTHSGHIYYFLADSGNEAHGLRLSLGDPIWHAPAPAGSWLYVRGSHVYGYGY